MRPAGRYLVSGAAIAIALGAGAGRAGAQTVAKDASWTLEGANGGYCIWYLADPDLARQLVPSSTSLLPAGSGGEVPALASYIKEEPRFAQWIPGVICIEFYERVSAGTHTIAQAKANKPIIIATNSIAARGAHGVADANQYLLDFMTNDHGVSNAADAIGVDMQSIEMVQHTKLEGEDPTVTLTLAGLQINWSGHAIGDSSVGKTRAVSFGYGGPKSSNWLISFESTPQTSRLLVAALWVEGKNTLAKVLKASPVRAIGPIEGSGSATLTFHIATKK